MGIEGIIRRLKPEDVQTYRDLMLKAYREHPEAFTSTPEERAALPISWWEARLAEGPNAREIVLGRFQGRQLVGVAGVAFGFKDKIRHKATLFGMYLSEAVRGRGIGQELLARALSECRNRPDVRIVQLTVTQGNTAAKALYKTAGFRVFGEEPDAVRVGTGYVTKVHLWLRL